eukprot:Platyproteum_vivax@DN4357_c0_g1_i2.p1
MNYFFLAILSTILSACFGQDFIDPMEHEVDIVTAHSFDRQINKNRDAHVQAVMFHKKDASSKDFLDTHWNPLATELKGLIKIAAIDCKEFKKFCEDSNVKDHPSVMIYPPNPIPPFFFDQMEKEKLKKKLMSLVPNNVKTLSVEELDTWMTSHLSVPKVMLFTEKKAAPVLLRALSNAFKNNMDFGLLSSPNSDVMKRFKLKKLPNLMVHRSDKKPEHYTGKMVYNDLFNWVNLFSETFVKGGGYGHDHGKAEEAKPWLVEVVPEVTHASNREVCFKGDKGLCVIYLREGPLTKEEESLLTDLSLAYTSKLDRGVQMRWLWMDMQKQTNYRELFALSKFPSLVVFNPHKRIRFTGLDDGVIAKKEAIRSLLDKILGGDARFKNVKPLPEFAPPEEAAEATPETKKKGAEL